jgi:SAM-dependent methyltransferase
MSGYYDGLNKKLLAAILPSQKVLEFGCSAGRLGEGYKRLIPSACWHGVDVDAPSLEVAAKRLDQVWQADLDSVDVTTFEGGYDCVVMGDVLEHLKAPERLLLALRHITTPDARLVCCIPNMAHISIVERMLIGDLSYDASGLMDRTHLRLFSQSAIFKLLLDSGWLPHLQDRYNAGHPNAALTDRLIACASSLGVSREAVERMLFTYQMIITCVQCEDTVYGTAVPVSVIVPVNNELQFALNVARSPGLKEIGAQILPCRGAESAADAFAQGHAQANGEWLLFCHQDMYFPVGWGFALSNLLGNVPVEQAEQTVVGFAGIGTMSPSDPYMHTFNAGLVIDRIHRYDWPAADRAVSLDEFAVVVHRGTRLAIDPALGWHLWATDLSLAAMGGEPPVFPRILRVPVYHNSLSGHSLPTAYYESAAMLAAKYPNVRGIKTLCGTVS